MAYTRLDLRTIIRRELLDTSGTPYWPDAQIHDNLIAAFGAYTLLFPNPLSNMGTRE